MILVLNFFPLKGNLHYCFPEFISLLFPLCIIAYFILWKLINTEKTKKITEYYFILLLSLSTQTTPDMLWRNYISQKGLFISFSQRAFMNRWEPFFFFFFCTKRNKYEKISKSTQGRYFAFTFLYYRINSSWRFL